MCLMKLCFVVRAMEQPEVEHLSSEEVSYCLALQCDVTSYYGIRHELQVNILTSLYDARIITV
jgi:hypothetical protein